MGKSNKETKRYHKTRFNFHRHILFISISLFFHCSIFSQVYTQNIRGSIVDKVSQLPLAGATVVLLNSDPVKGTTADAEGNFKLPDVPVGKQSIKISLLGFKELILQNLVVNSGKELIVAIALEENIIQGKEVVVTAELNKNRPLNDMALVSARTFSVEETQKYAGSFNDPARMALAYAGVVQAGDIKNDISIRGNSPNGLVWRMEGVDIPDPNHFSYVGSSGGAISILSSQLLTNSDFLTGAFPAEYGNALSGVFDLRLRKGNNEKQEFTAQIGFLGTDLSTEGPFKKGYEGSYLINYRYSTLALLAKIGVPLAPGTVFQDLSFNVWLPTKKIGNFSVFGLGGLSSGITEGIKDSSKWVNSFDPLNTTQISNTGVVGITHTKNLGSTSFIKTVLAVSETENGYKEDALNTHYVALFKDDQSYFQNKITLSSTLNNKLSQKLNLRSGIIVTRLGYSFSKSAVNPETNLPEQLLNAEGSSFTAQAFSELSYHASEKWTLNGGLHYLHFLLNNSNSLEPRASAQYKLSSTQSLSFGYGLHSQLQPLGVYFTDTTINGIKYQPNKDLGLSKSHHFVLAYDKIINEHMRIKVETYYQWLFNIPVAEDASSTFSILNLQNGYTTQTLVNSGTGRNYGIELTLEQFMLKNFYCLFSTSLFNSEYRALDNIWRNTYYAANYNFTLTLGKEIMLSEKHKKRIIGLNMKTIYTGGYRKTPIDLAQSALEKETVYVQNEAFTQRYPDYFRIDIRLSVKRNFAKLTSTVSLDVQNLTSYKNVRMQFFDPVTGAVKTEYQVPLTPVLSYRVEF